MLKFTTDHEWVRVEGDVATCGITDFAQGQLGDVVYVELPAVGTKFTKGKEAAVVESVKAASDVYAPVSGEVVEVNDALTGEPALVNTGAETGGWFFKIRLSNTAELDGLLDLAGYKAHTGSSLLNALSPLTEADRRDMLAVIGAPSVEALFKDVPAAARRTQPVDLPGFAGELDVQRQLEAMANKNIAAGSVPFFVGAGAYRHHVPASVDYLIQRGEFLTAYTPYQPEIAQGTLQVLFEFQTQVALLTGMDVANASMYDGSTACVEAVQMANRITRRTKALLSGGLHPHYAEIVETHARYGGFTVVQGAPDFAGTEDLIAQIDDQTSCVVVQNPNFFGRLRDLTKLAEAAHAKGALLIVAVTEVVSLGAVTPPGDMGADIVIAEGQSIGSGLNFGGPYVGLFATKEKYVRQMPGRLCGETVDADGKRGFVLTLSTREQHIRREKATSNICTNAGLCALAFTIHLSLLGEAGLTQLAALNHAAASRLADKLAGVKGVEVLADAFFNEFTVKLSKPAAEVVEALAAKKILAGVPASRLIPNDASVANLLVLAATECTTDADMDALVAGLKEGAVMTLDRSQGRVARDGIESNADVVTFTGNRGLQLEEKLIFEMGEAGRTGVDLPATPNHADKLGGLARKGGVGLPGLAEPQVVRHYTRLSQKNYGIDSGFFPLGSCTMKHNPRLNERVARLPGFGDIHPLQPTSTVQGALQLIDTLAHWLKTLTGMPAVAMSPAAGAHGELCGMVAIKAALEARGEGHRTRVLVPESAHGTNPATAAVIGFTVDPIPATEAGRVDLAAFKAKLGPDVAAIMLTNPNTCGLFESDIREIADAIHEAGGYFYCDGANFNAIVGRVRPGDLGVDCMHINLHKTFSTPHGGGGPGSGPVVLSERLAAFAPLPWTVLKDGKFQVLEQAEGDAKAAFGRLKAFHGQMGMFVRALAYMLSHGADGLWQVSGDAVLNANYILASLKDVMTAPFEGPCMHEALFDDRFLEGTGVSTLDFAKALIDEGYHPMTMYFPLVVHGALLIEPTETEDKQTLDLFIGTLRSLAERAKAGAADEFHAAPRLTPRRRLDETLAARKPVLRWKRPGDNAMAAE